MRLLLATALESPFTEEETWEAIKNCDREKALGPDNFFKNKWDLIKRDIMNFLLEFYQIRILLKEIVISFIALIVKNQCPESLYDLRPISLIGSLYKILTKVLANRLHKVMDVIIHPTQTSFIASRQIMDGSLIASEAMHSLKKTKKKVSYSSLILKRHSIMSDGSFCSQ